MITRIAALAACLLAAGTASAFELTGGDAALSGAIGDRSYGQAQTDLSVGLFGNIGTQINLRQRVYSNGDTSPLGEAHLTYSLPVGISAGLFWGNEYLGDSYAYRGLEVAGVTGALSYDVAFSKYHGDGGAFRANYLTIDGKYAINDRLAVTGGYHTATGDELYYYAGAEYGLQDNLLLTGGYGYMDASAKQGVLNLGVSYRFGNGPLFKSRSRGDAIVGQ